MSDSLEKPVLWGSKGMVDNLAQQYTMDSLMGNMMDSVDLKIEEMPVLVRMCS